MLQKKQHHVSLGWGIEVGYGVEVWDTEPAVNAGLLTWKTWARLLFYPKKFLLYSHIIKALQQKNMKAGTVRILDIGCGTGASVIDLKRLFGSHVDVVGVDVVRLQVELAQKKLDTHNIDARVLWYDGKNLPFENNTFDAVYTSDVLGHVADVPMWLLEINRVLTPHGTLAMFSESALGRHAWIRQYLFCRGLNIDPHARFHISLFSKQKLRSLIEQHGFHIQRMVSVFWPAFLLHPDEFYPALQTQQHFPVLRVINRALTWLKKRTHPYFSAVAELYGLLEMVTIGRWIESQGYIVLAKKK